MLRHLDEISCALRPPRPGGGAVRPLDRRQPGESTSAAREPELDRPAWLADFVAVPADPGGGWTSSVPRRRRRRAGVDHLTRTRQLRDRSIFIGEHRQPGAGPLGPAYRRSARGPRSASGSPATSRLRPARSPTATRSAPSSATRPMSGSAWCPRRLGRRDRPAATRDRHLPGGEAAHPGAAHGRGRGPRIDPASFPRPTAWTRLRTPAVWRDLLAQARATSRSPRRAVHHDGADRGRTAVSYFPLRGTSSRTTTSPSSTATAPGAGWTSSRRAGGGRRRARRGVGPRAALPPGRAQRRRACRSVDRRAALEVDRDRVRSTAVLIQSPSAATVRISQTSRSGRSRSASARTASIASTACRRGTQVLRLDLLPRARRELHAEVRQPLRATDRAGPAAPCTTSDRCRGSDDGRPWPAARRAGRPALALRRRALTHT